MKFKLLVRILVILSLVFLFPNFTNAQESPLIISNSISIEFGKNILFIAELNPEFLINKINLVISSEEDQKNIEIPLEIIRSNKITFNYAAEIYGDFSPFNTVEYYFVAELKDGNFIQSSTFDFIYLDNNFNWKYLETESPFTVIWYEGDIAFAKDISETAGKSISHLQQYINFPPIEDPITIIVFPNSRELQDAITLNDHVWLAGQAIPRKGLVIISVTPGIDQQSEIDRQTPHELAHLSLYQASKDQYLSLPNWFNEGIASLAELERNGEYPIILQSAYNNGKLISFEELCEFLPQNSTQLAIAYAQSESFIMYLFNKYGKSGLNNLLMTYNGGKSCLEGVSLALGSSLPQLEEKWIQSTFQDIQDEEKADNFMPYLFLLGLVSLPLIIVSFIRASNQSKNLGA